LPSELPRRSWAELLPAPDPAPDPFELLIHPRPPSHVDTAILPAHLPAPRAWRHRL